jgi:hypothetical protein
MSYYEHLPVSTHESWSNLRNSYEGTIESLAETSIEMSAAGASY